MEFTYSAGTSELTDKMAIRALARLLIASLQVDELTESSNNTDVIHNRNPMELNQ